MDTWQCVEDRDLAVGDLYDSGVPVGLFFSISLIHEDWSGYCIT
jgi:hypothetical protein